MVRAVRVRASAARAMVTEEPLSSLPSLKQMRIRLLVRRARGKYNLLSPTADPMMSIPGGEIVKFVLSQHGKLRFKSGRSQITNHKSQICNCNTQTQWVLGMLHCQLMDTISLYLGGQWWEFTIVGSRSYIGGVFWRLRVIYCSTYVGIGFRSLIFETSIFWQAPPKSDKLRSVCNFSGCT